MRFFPIRIALSAGVLCVLAPLGVVAPDAIAAPYTPASQEGGTQQEGTVLIASSGRLVVTEGLALEDIKAQLRSSENGEPLAGKEIFFFDHTKRPLGKAVTDGAGTVRLNTVPAEIGPATAGELLGGYTAVFHGDSYHQAASGSGTIRLAV